MEIYKFQRNCSKQSSFRTHSPLSTAYLLTSETESPKHGLWDVIRPASVYTAYNYTSLVLSLALLFLLGSSFIPVSSDRVLKFPLQTSAYAQDIAEGIQIDLHAIAQIESSNRPHVIGDGGKAHGLYQLHQPVISDYNKRHKTKYSQKDALNPQISRLIASWYVHQELPRLLYHYKIKISYKTILWAYNAGIGSVKKGVMPKITKNYIAKYERLTKEAV